HAGRSRPPRHRRAGQGRRSAARSTLGRRNLQAGTSGKRQNRRPLADLLPQGARRAFAAGAWSGSQSIQTSKPWPTVGQSGPRSSDSRHGTAAASRTDLQAGLRESPQGESLHRSGRADRRLTASPHQPAAPAKSVFAERLGACAERLQLEGIVMPGQTAPSFPPPLPRSFGSSRRTLRPSRIVVIALLLLSALLAGEYVWLHARQEARAIAQDNERVADRMELARAHLATQHWEEAIRHLEDAQAIERSTNREVIRPLLEQARRGQAAALLEAAGLAIVHKDAANALRLLHAYTVHPWATNLDRAHLLRKDLERATSSEEAAQFLAHL